MMLDKISQSPRVQNSARETSEPASASAVAATKLLKLAALSTIVVASRATGALADGNPVGQALSKPSFPGLELRDVPADANPRSLMGLPAAATVASSAEPRYLSAYHFAMACLEGVHVGQQNRDSVELYIDSIRNADVRDAYETCVEGLQATAAGGGCVTRGSVSFSEDCLDDAASFFPHEWVDPLAFPGYRAFAPGGAPGPAPALAPNTAPRQAPAPDAI